MENDFVAVCGDADESFTCTVNDDVPEFVGVPLIVPVKEFKLRPGGNEPAVTLQE